MNVYHRDLTLLQHAFPPRRASDLGVKHTRGKGGVGCSIHPGGTIPTPGKIIPFRPFWRLCHPWADENLSATIGTIERLLAGSGVQNPYSVPTAFRWE